MKLSGCLFFKSNLVLVVVLVLESKAVYSPLHRKRRQITITKVHNVNQNVKVIILPMEHFHISTLCHFLIDLLSL